MIKVEIDKLEDLSEEIEYIKNEIYLHDLVDIKINVICKENCSKVEIVEIIKKYSADEIRYNNQQILVIKKSGKKILRFSLVVAVAIIVVIWLISGLFPDRLQIILGILTIMAWVLIWRPVDMLFFDWREYADDNSAYGKLVQITESSVEVN